MAKPPTDIVSFSNIDDVTHANWAQVLFSNGAVSFREVISRFILNDVIKERIKAGSVPVKAAVINEYQFTKVDETMFHGDYPHEVFKLDGLLIDVDPCSIPNIIRAIAACSISVASDGTSYARIHTESRSRVTTIEQKERLQKHLSSISKSSFAQMSSFFTKETLLQNKKR
jgi:hypothetical protein